MGVSDKQGRQDDDDGVPVLQTICDCDKIKKTGTKGKSDECRIFCDITDKIVITPMPLQSWFFIKIVKCECIPKLG